MARRGRRHFKVKYGQSKDKAEPESNVRIVIDKYDSGAVLCKRRYEQGLLHCRDGPAWVTMTADGQIAFESWFEFGRWVKTKHHTVH